METFVWKTKDKKIVLSSLKELLGILANISQEDINGEINQNVRKLPRWLEQNFPKQIDLTESIKQSLAEFTPQQMRELIIRKLRKITL